MFHAQLIFSLIPSALSGQLYILQNVVHPVVMIQESFSSGSSDARFVQE